MTRITISPPSLRRTANVIKEVGLDYLGTARELETLAADFPKMDAAYTARIRPELEAVVEAIATLVLFHDPDVAAMQMAADIIERDQEGAWGQSLGGPVDILDAAYRIVDDVYGTARRYGMSLHEALDHMKADKVTSELTRLLGEEGTVAPAKMSRLTGAAGVGLDFLQEYARSDGSLWEATQRTLVSSGGFAVGAAGFARVCGRFTPIPLIKGSCLLIGGAFGEELGERINEKLFDRGKRTPEERQRLRAAMSPSGLTPAQERQRVEDAREGFEQARRDLVEGLVAQGEDREEAEHIAEMVFPEYLVELSP